MPLELLTGASGHGKTYQLYEQLLREASENPHKKYILIVPEQSSLQAQKAIVHMHKDHGLFNIDVLTFGRLAYRIFEELGIELPETIDENGKILLARRALALCAKDLKLIRPNKSQGFTGDVKSILSEMKQYGMTPQKLAEVIENMQGQQRLKDKLSDLLLIYNCYEKLLENRYITSEDKPELLLRVIEQSSFLKDTIVAMDGFTGFTPVQYRLLSYMLEVCEKIMITVTIPQDEPYNTIREEELFYMSKQMMYKCSELADHLHQQVTVLPFHTNPEKYRFARAKELDFLEKHIFRYDGETYKGDSSRIAIRHLSNCREEVAFVVADIRRKLLSTQYRYRDFAIVTGDVSSYRDELCRVLKEADISYFLDDKRSLLGNPLVEFIRGALSVVYKNASYEALFTFLKNELVEFDSEERDILENYVLATGIRGWNKYSERFVRKYPGKVDDGYHIDEINASRDFLYQYLNPFFESIKSGHTVSDYILSIYQLLEENGVYDRMNALAEEFEKSNQTDLMARASEYRAAYGQVISLFERMHALIGEEELSLKEFSDMLDAGFDAVKVGLIPPSTDCITIGDLKRTRLEHIKVLYVIGVNEGLIPKTEAIRGVLSEQERELLEKAQVELSPTPRTRLYEQNFYLYLNLTEPEDYLIMTYHSMNNQGENARPSRVIHMLDAMYGNIICEAELGVNDLLYGQGNAFHLATDLMKPEMGDDYLSLLSYLWCKEQYKQILSHMLTHYSIEIEKDSLSKETARQLYHKLQSASISRIERFAKCAFSHFASYGLELSEREIYRFDNTDLGSICHDVLCKIGTELHNVDRDYSMLSGDERTRLIDKCLDEKLVDYGNSILADSHINRYMRVRIHSILDRTIWALGEQIKAGVFRPEGFESRFELDYNGQSIIGTIDRYDIAEVDGQRYVKIVDYKSYAKQLKFEDIYTGIDLQLMVYLYDILEKQKRANPDQEVFVGGAVYSYIKNPVVPLEYSDKNPNPDIESALLSEYCSQGAMNTEAAKYFDRTLVGASVKSIVIDAKTDKTGMISTSKLKQTERNLIVLSKYAMDKICDMSDEIAAGEVSVNPYKESCEYCNYQSICGIKRPNQNHTYRSKSELSLEDLYRELMEGEQADAQVDSGSGESN